MSSMHAFSRRPGLFAGCCGLAMGLLGSAAGAGDLKGPGGDSFIWLGNGASNWNIGVNWDVGQVPNHDAVVIVNGGLSNVSLNAASAQLSSLSLSGGITLSNNAHPLSVNGTAGETTVSGGSTRLFVSALGSGLPGFSTERLTLDGSRLQLSQGLARVTDRLIMHAGSDITGHGRFEVISSNPVAFSGADGEAIRASAGGLTIAVSGGGAIALPELLQINGTGTTLSIEGPLFVDDVNEVDMNTGNTLAIDSPWVLQGLLTTEDGASTITGAPFEVSATGEIGVLGGTLSVQPPVDLAAGSTVNVVGGLTGGATLILNGPGSDAKAGSVVEVGVNGRLRFGAAQPLGEFWSGTIDLTAAALELGVPGRFSVNGDIVMNSFGGLRPRIEGPGTMYLSGDMTLPGGGGAIAGTMELTSGGLIETGTPNTVLRVDGTLRHNTATSIIGPGRMEVSPGGVYEVSVPSTMLVDVVNAGRVEIDGAFDSTAAAVWSVDYTQETTGTLVVEIEGFAVEDADRIDTTGAADLAGAVEVVLLNGFEPTIGTVWEIVEAAGGVTGGFSSVVGAPGFEVETSGDTVLLIYVGVTDCVADYNGDGLLNFFDVQAFLADFNDDLPSADLTDDGHWDFFDVAMFLNHYNAGCP